MAGKRKKIKRGQAEPPTVNCLLLCADVRESRKHRTHTLEDVVNVIVVPGVPVSVGGLVLYMRMSNVYGLQRVKVSWQHESDEETDYAFEIQTHPLANPLGLVTTCESLPPLPSKN